MAILQGYDCDNRFFPPKIEVFYLAFLGIKGLGKKEKGLGWLKMSDDTFAFRGCRHIGRMPSYWEELQKLADLETHLNKCTKPQKASDWVRLLVEADDAIQIGASESPQFLMCRDEAHLKLINPNYKMALILRGNKCGRML